MIRNAARRTFRVSYLIVGVLLILLALITVCVRLGLPLVASQKAGIESRVSEYLNSPVEIGELSLRWEGWGPMLRAERVSVLEAVDRAVTLDEILIDINLAKSLLRGIPIINELSLVGARLAVDADMDGQYRLHGMESLGGAPAAADGNATSGGGVDIVAWLFNAGKVALLDTQLTLIDMVNDHTLIIENLNVRAENSAQGHQLRVDAQLPASLGGRLEAGLDMVGHRSALMESEGSLYFAADSISLEGLMTLLRSGGIVPTNRLQSLDAGAEASVEMWGRWQDGQLISASGPVTVGKVVDPVSGDILLDGASAQLRLSVTEHSIDITAADVQASLGDSSIQIERLMASRIAPLPSVVAQNDKADSEDNAKREQLSVAAASLNGKRKRGVSAWHFSGAASRIPADMIVPLYSIAIPALQPELAQILKGVALDGQINNLSFDVSGTRNEPFINASMNMDSLTFEGAQQLPSFGPISGELSMVNSTGQLSLVARSMPLSWPVASDIAVQLESLDTTIEIDVRNPDQVEFSANLQLVDEGIDTTTRASLTLMPDLSPHLDLQSQFDVADITAIKSWLPRKLMNPAATAWIDRAITAGAGADGSLLFFGHLSEFPFDDGQGVFKGFVDVRDAELVYLPDWPRATDINGTLQLDGLSLVGVAQSATLDQFNVSQTRITIADLTLPTLTMSGTASGGFQQVVDFGVNGPLTDILKPAIGDMSGSGAAQMDLALELSLFRKPTGTDENPGASAWRPFSVNGSLFLDKNDVLFGRAELELEDIHGAVAFSEQGIVINNLQGQLLGHDVRVSGETVGQGDNANTAIKITGAMEANDLLAHYGNPLDQFIRGASQWRVTVTAPHSLQRVADEGVGLSISSDLVGTQLLLPVPFNKGTSAAVDFTLNTSFRDGAAQQQWDAVYGNELQARAMLEDDEFKSLLVQLGDGEIADAGQPSTLEGIVLQGSVPSLAADDWIETVARYIDSLPSDEGSPQPILPVSSVLDTDALILGRYDFGQASMRATTDETYLSVEFSNPALKGNLRYPREHWTKQTALKAHLELLDWSVIDALSESSEEVTDSAAEEMDPRLLPPIEARVSVLRRDNVQVQDLVMRTQPNDNGLDISTLGFVYDTIQLAGQGYWHVQDSPEVSASLPGKHASALDMVLQSNDFGAGFDEIGLSGIIDDGQGSIRTQLSWPGALYNPNVARLDGNVSIDLKAGSIVPLEPAAGRVIGLFALQALPRRLNLDFKDLTGEGLAFKSIAGNAVIEDGVAQVPLLQLTGPVGVVDIAGSSDLNTRQFNQRVTVLPRVSAALPVIGAISAGATGGIGALVATGVLKALGVDFDRLGLRTYQLTGSWTDPDFTPVPSDLLR